MKKRHNEFDRVIMKIHRMMQLARSVGRNEIDRVESLCKEALEVDPHDLFALGVLADTHWRNGQHELALSFALRTLEITPNDFNALRIAAHVYSERSEDETAYQYAKRLCVADTPALPLHKEVFSLLKPFAWIPRIRRLRQKAIVEQTSCTDWMQWAQDYVAWYESQLTMEQ